MCFRPRSSPIRSCQCCYDRPLLNVSLCRICLTSLVCEASTHPPAITRSLMSATRSIVYRIVQRSCACVRYWYHSAVSSHHIGSTPVGTSTPPKLCSQGGIGRCSAQGVWVFCLPSRLQLCHRLATSLASHQVLGSRAPTKSFRTPHSALRT